FPNIDGDEETGARDPPRGIDRIGPARFRDYRPRSAGWHHLTGISTGYAGQGGSDTGRRSRNRAMDGEYPAGVGSIDRSEGRCHYQRRSGGVNRLLEKGGIAVKCASRRRPVTPSSPWRNSLPDGTVINSLDHPLSNDRGSENTPVTEPRA